ncbi:MAG: hypothetical protein KA319_13565, partial [Ferruginibacter sp.]|nr:hypothetical protein [Ferruginibacter sp.]
MKKIILALFLIYTTNLSFSQNNNCEDVKKQNAKLIDKLLSYGINISDSIIKIKSFNSDININFIKCIGDKKNQTVTLYLNAVNNELPNQNFSVTKSSNIDVFKPVNSSAFDEIGQGFRLYQMSIGSSGLEKYSDYVSAK